MELEKALKRYELIESQSPASKNIQIKKIAPNNIPNRKNDYSES